VLRVHVARLTTRGTLGSLIGPRNALWVLLAGNVLPGLILASSPLRNLPDLPDRPAALPSAVPAMPHTGPRARSAPR
jgi:hypothetical protein